MKTFKLNVQIAYNLKIKSYKWPENKIIKSKNEQKSISIHKLKFMIFFTN